MASSTAPSASTVLALLKEQGFDPDEMNQACRVTGGIPLLLTPMDYYSASGNITIAWCRLSNRRFEWMVSHDSRSIRRRSFGDSLLRIALNNGYFEVVYWLIRKGALAPLDDVNGDGIDDDIMRRDLREEEIDPWKHDKRLTVLSWARDAITAHDTVKILLLTGTIVPTSLFRRHPNNPCATRSNKRRKKSSSPLVLLKGKAGILELIAHYVAGTPQQLRPLRQLNVLLSAFIEDTPFETHVDQVDITI